MIANVDKNTRHTVTASMTHSHMPDPNLAPFRNLDLAPESRIEGVGELGIFRDSFDCDPQILPVSKQINAEATNIINGGNFFRE